MYTKSLDSFIHVLASRDNCLVQPHSAVSAFTETVGFLKRSLASMLIRYCCSMIGCYFLSRQNRFAETHSYLHVQLSYHIRDRLLAAGNNPLGTQRFRKCWLVTAASETSQFHNLSFTLETPQLHGWNIGDTA